MHHFDLCQHGPQGQHNLDMEYWRLSASGAGAVSVCRGTHIEEDENVVGDRRLPSVHLY